MSKQNLTGLPTQRTAEPSDNGDNNEDQRNLFFHQASSKLLETVETADNKPQEQIKKCLPYLQAVLFACMMEDAISQLRILDECNNELRIIKTMSEMDTLRTKKYQVKQPRVIDELAGVNKQNLHCMQFKLDKLAGDRIYFTDVLMRTYLELALHRCYSCITESIKDIEQRELKNFCLNQDEARNRTYRRDLMRQLRQQRNHITSVAYDTDLVIDQFKSKVEDAQLNAETRGRYIDNWQGARSEQHLQTICDTEAGPADSMKYFRRRMDQEARVHSEVELLVNIFINDTLTKVESWMNKYDTDIEEVDLKIQIMKNNYQNILQKRLEMEETFAEHERQMKNWTQFKDDREKARQYSDTMTKAAIVVQAWWRGLLVRLELGPFKPKKRPPPPPPGSKKKK